MVVTGPSSKKEIEDDTWNETFGREWELMRSIDEWMDVFIWEIDRETIRFANKKARTVLMLVCTVFDDHSGEISKAASKDEKHVRVKDVLNWVEKQAAK